MKLKDFIKNLVKEATNEIIILAASTLDNTDKKDKLDETILDYVQTTMDKVKINPIVKLILKKVIVSLIPTLTQLIYDLLKSKVQGVTV